MKLLTNQPALMLGKDLIIADLHLGIECEAGVISIAHSKAREVIQRIIELILMHNAKRVIILGDVKHLLPKREKFEFEKAIAKAVPNLISQIASIAEVVIIKGNHDGGLFSPNFTVEKEILLDNILLVHGHRWPSAEIIRKCKKIICAHTHPCWAFVDAFGHREIKKVFVFGRVTKRFFERYGIKARAIEVVVMPAFNEFVGGTAVNEREMLGPLLKKGIFKVTGIYLLDGTRLK